MTVQLGIDVNGGTVDYNQPPFKFPRQEPGEKPSWDDAPEWAQSIGICEMDCYEYFGKWCFCSGTNPFKFSQVEWSPTIREKLGDLNRFIGVPLKKSSRKPFKSGEKIGTAIRLTINQYDVRDPNGTPLGDPIHMITYRMLAFVMDDGSVVDTHQCETLDCGKIPRVLIPDADTLETFLEKL